MAVKRPGPLVRTNFLDPTQANYATIGNPNLAGFDPKNVLPRSGATSHGEDKVDVEQYNRPVGQLHGNAMHGAGVAWGFQISATVGQTGVTFAPGIALEPAGRHIYLALNGQAEIGPTADQPGTNPNLVTVTAAGVALPTLPLTGDYFAVVQWWETFDQASWINSGGQVSQFNHTPWLQLVQAANYNPDLHVVLGKVHLDAQSKVTALSYGDVGALQRTSVTVPAQSIHFRRAVNSAGPKADSLPWGEMRAREGGGLQIASDYITAQSSAGIEPMIMNAGNGVLQVGTAGQHGEVWAINAQGNYAVTMYAGPTAQLIVGGPGNAGKVRVKDVNRVDQVSLDGSNGSAIVRRLDPTDQALIDVGARFFRIHGWDLVLDGRSGGNKRALVDGNNKLVINWAGDYGQGVEVASDLAVDGVLSAKGDILMGNPVRKVAIRWLFATSAASTVDVDLGSPRLFTAFGTVVMINSTTNFDYDNAVFVDIVDVDGTATGTWVTGCGSNFGCPGDSRNMQTPSFSGVGQHIKFRVWAVGPDIQAAALAIVFFE